MEDNLKLRIAIVTKMAAVLNPLDKTQIIYRQPFLATIILDEHYINIFFKFEARQLKPFFRKVENLYDFTLLRH